MKFFPGLIVFVLGVSGCNCVSTEVVFMRDYGLSPETPENAAEKIQRAFSDCIKTDRPVELRLEKGTYEIYLNIEEEMDPGNRYPVLLDIHNVKHFKFNGGGSTFYFHGLSGLANIRESADISLENFVIDWHRPYITEAELVSISPEHIDLRIDHARYPYKIEDGRVKYICDDGDYGVVEHSYCNFLTPQGKIVPGTVDYYDMFRILNGPVEVMKDGVLRFLGKMPEALFRHEDGNGSGYSALTPPLSRFLIYHVRYKALWCYSALSEDIELKDIVIHHCTGCGLISDCCHNILIDNVDYIPSEGRVFTGVADAFHISHASGLVEVKNCYVNGQGDDALNIHGRYYPVDSLSADRKTISCSRRYLQMDYITCGDSIWFVPKGDMKRSGKYAVKALSKKGKSLEMILSEAVDTAGFGPEFYVENASRNPQVYIHDNHFGSGNRARGILITTPEKAVVENNLFESSGSAILIEGDLNYWYESGGVRDLLIRNNVFKNCRTSDWGKAVIALTPSSAVPGYHSGVRITGNKFIMDSPAEVLYSVDPTAVTFSDDNEIINSPAS